MAITLDGHLGKSLYLKVGIRGLSIAGINTFYPAATISTSTVSGDTPASTWVPGVLEPSLNFGKSLFSGADPRNISSQATGLISLVDVDAQLDYLYDYGWDGVDIELYRGPKLSLLNTWSLVGKYTGHSIIGDMDKKKIRLRDSAWKLAGLIHREYYGGGGGADGDANIAGQWKPVLLGKCFNIEPILINSSLLIYQFNMIGGDSSVQDVRHGGVSLTFHADYGNYSDLAAATIPSGKYGTCADAGLVRPSVTLDKSIRLDATGGLVDLLGTGTASTRAQIARRIAIYPYGVQLNNLTEIDSTTFTAVGSAQTGPLGFYWRTETTKAEALTEIMSGIMGWWYIKNNGKLAIGYARDPASETSAETLTYRDFGMSKIEMMDYIQPRAVSGVGWRKNYGPEPRSQLAAGVTSEDYARLLGEETSWAMYDTAVATQAFYPSAETVKIQGNFVNEADAATECQRQHTLMNSPRRRFRCTMEIDQFAEIIDQTLTFSGVNRITLGSSKKLLCVAVDGVGFGPIVTEWWG